MTDTIELTALPLEPGGTVIANGMPIHMTADGKIMVPKHVRTLTRDQLILDEKDADTATKRIYFILQGMLMNPASANVYHDELMRLVDDRAEVTELKPVLLSLAIMAELVRKGDYQNALELCGHLVQFDDALVREFPVSAAA